VFTQNRILTVGREWEAIPAIHGICFCGLNMVTLIHTIRLRVCVSHHQLNIFEHYINLSTKLLTAPIHTPSLCVGPTGVLEFVLSVIKDHCVLCFQNFCHQMKKLNVHVTVHRNKFLFNKIK